MVIILDEENQARFIQFDRFEGGGRKGERGREKERERENHSLKMTSKLRNFSSGFLTPAKARRRQSSNSDQSGGKQET